MSHLFHPLSSARRALSALLALLLLLSLSACGSDTGYGVKAVQTLVEQEYSMAFRNNDPLIYYVVAAVKVLAAQGRIDELAGKWFGTASAVSFEKDSAALDNLAVPENKTFIVGVDANSFPLVYSSNGTLWGFDIELAIAVTELLGWTLKTQVIEKEKIYDELASGNIDCAWGGLALDPKDISSGRIVQYGPYMKNSIVIATRDGTASGNLKGKTLAMPSTTEALNALNTDPRLADRLGNVIRLVGGTMECFTYLYNHRCDAILTDSTAILYYNCH